MKKNLFVLSAVALAVASSAQAYTLVDSEQTGTKLDLTGSARIVWRSTSNKTTDANGNEKKEHINHAVANNGSRFGFKITQQLGNGFYGLGNVEWRFRGTAKSQHDFDDIYTRQLYAGFGHKQYGQLTYGHMTVITDHVKQTDLGNTLSLSDGLLVGSARKVAQYVYNGSDSLQGLTVGGYYGGKSKRNNLGLDLTNERKNVFGLAALYHHKIDDAQSIKFGTGVSRETSYNTNRSTYDRIAYAFDTAYTYNNTTFGIDLERAVTDDQGAAGNKRVQKEVRTVLNQDLNKEWRVYTMYAYKTNRFDSSVSSDTERKAHQFMVGTEYTYVPESAKWLKIKGFVEGATSREKNYTNGARVNKTRDNIAAIGLRVFW